jgi:hypothetical protein
VFICDCTFLTYLPSSSHCGARYISVTQRVQTWFIFSICWAWNFYLHSPGSHQPLPISTVARELFKKQDPFCAKIWNVPLIPVNNFLWCPLEPALQASWQKPNENVVVECNLTMLHISKSPGETKKIQIPWLSAQFPSHKYFTATPKFVCVGCLGFLLGGEGLAVLGFEFGTLCGILLWLVSNQEEVPFFCSLREGQMATLSLF